MKRLIIPVLILALAASAFFTRAHWLPQPAGHLNHLGYVEGKTMLIGAPQAGRLVSVEAVEGRGVKKGEALFALDPAVAEADVARAEAAARIERAAWQNLLTGKREEEIAVIRAQAAQVEASLALARKDMQRAMTLASTGTAARSRLDQSTEQVGLLEARLRELQAQEQVAALPARPAEIEAQAARLAEAEAELEMAKQKLADLSPVAPVNARAEDVFFQPGEWVTAGQPVVSLLAPEDVTVRFFLPEASLAKAAPGTMIRFHCGGCSGVKTAAITHVATAPEYTPPIIYSEAARTKLVYLVEAKPVSPDPELRPGLPVSVEPLE